MHDLLAAGTNIQKTRRFEIQAHPAAENKAPSQSCSPPAITYKGTHRPNDAQLPGDVQNALYLQYINTVLRE